jgi:hypothetical protein
VTLDARILNRVAGYWPGYRMTPQAIQAWTHKLDGLSTQQILDALDAFCDEDAKTPPRAGELRKRVVGDTQKSSGESEPDRCKRQLGQYLELMNGPHGSNTSRTDFDWYWDSYWSKHLPESAYPFTQISQANAA